MFHLIQNQLPLWIFQLRNFINQWILALYCHCIWSWPASCVTPKAFSGDSGTHLRAAEQNWFWHGKALLLTSPICTLDLYCRTSMLVRETHQEDIVGISIESYLASDIIQANIWGKLAPSSDESPTQNNFNENGLRGNMIHKFCMYRISFTVSCFIGVTQLPTTFIAKQVSGCGAMYHLARACK